MRYLSRVVWSEGMYLGPHHFQVQSRYFEDSVQFATTALWHSAYGLLDYRIDEDALYNGSLSLIHARGILPDGLIFHIPEADPPPPPRRVEDSFPPARESLTALLAVAPRREQLPNCSTNGPLDGVRYLAEARTFADDNTGRDEKPVQVGRKNLRLLFDTEPAGDLVTLPLAAITRDSSGRYVLDKTFVPPCLRISASDHLMEMLRRLVEILEEKSAALSPAAARGQSAKTWAEYSTRDIANFWFLHSLHSALAALRHQYFTKQGHPEEVFLEMLRLGGALCTFSLDSHPSQLPLYDHRNLGQCFGALENHILSHLELVAPSNCVPVPLAKVADYFYAGAVTDTRCLGPSRWILAVRSTAGEVSVISKTPQLVKVCSKAFVGELVKRALPGMALVHLPAPPAALAVRPDTQYFSLTTAGPCWEHILKTKEVGVYVPGELGDPQVELFVIVGA